MREQFSDLSKKQLFHWASSWFLLYRYWQNWLFKPFLLCLGCWKAQDQICSPTQVKYIGEALAFCTDLTLDILFLFIPYLPQLLFLKILLHWKYLERVLKPVLEQNRGIVQNRIGKKLLNPRFHPQTIRKQNLFISTSKKKKMQILMLVPSYSTVWSITSSICITRSCWEYRVSDSTP